MRRRDRVAAIVERELWTLLRSRVALALAIGFFGIIVGLGGVSMGAPGGYVSLTYDLLLPVEVLVPTLAFAYAYQSVRGDDERGELAVIRTYDVSRLEYVAGVFVGRAAVLLVVVLTSLGAAGVVASVGANQPVAFFATHSAGDTPLVYARFAVFAALYALVAAALAVAVSAATRTSRQALAASVGVLLAVAVALDLAVVTLVSANVVDAASIAVFTGLSPASAFRGLVLEVAIQPALAVSPSVATASPLVSGVGLLGWLAASVTVATVAIWPESA
ncbi:ABC-type transport system permease protein (probable substrate copper) (plasmid) [Halobacterium hubeiense]|uniref:ABC-type transport system permease protein (Probable substrate copper) n=1 Tax=Halobacterium hubeiense TaxID=1407499 RepID=A0A0U5HAN3_9EURY|nr:ABC transporter permease subunit [Halobacterium hubeiense]CQH63331.1 ABC-type transport system permease protein (probable substrate copper) [Halobacterium hubeiense]